MSLARELPQLLGVDAKITPVRMADVTLTAQPPAPHADRVDIASTDMPLQWRAVSPPTDVLANHEAPTFNAAQRSGNPPASVRQPSARTRLIVAIAFVGGVALLALTICARGGCGR